MNSHGSWFNIWSIENVSRWTVDIQILITNTINIKNK